MKLRYVFLLLLSYFLILFFMINITPCNAFDWKGLNSDNVAEKISDSLKTEPEKWIVKSTSLTYFEDDQLREYSNKMTWPEVQEGCLIEVSHSVMGNDDGYIIIEKPFKVNFQNENKEKMKTIIRQFIYNYLHNEFGLELSEKKQVKVEEVKEEVKVYKQQKSVDNDIYGNSENVYK